MASKKVFDAMEAGDWGRAKEVIASTSWTPVDLQQQHGVMRDTLLITAARLGRDDVVHLLLDAGAAIEADDKNEWTPLMAAARAGHYEVVALLVDRGANINAQNVYDGSALMLSAGAGHVAVVKLLCRKGADLGIKDIAGYDALQCAVLQLQMPWKRDAMNIIIAFIQNEKVWRRVKNFVVFLHTVGLSAADWSGGGSAIPTMGGFAAHHHPDMASLDVTLTSKHRKVLENRDLCRIVSSYIPKTL